MWPDVGYLRDFYRQEKGQAVRFVLRRRLRALWPDLSHVHLLGMGYSAPYLHPFREEAGFIASFAPGPMGTSAWPKDGARQSAIVEEEEWPLPDCCMDRILLIHCLEFAAQPENLLREAWRVLVPGGRILALVPHRRSLWARSETTPFGYGQPFSQGQIRRLFQAQSFRARHLTRGLYLPLWWPRPGLRSAWVWERYGVRWTRGLGGLLMIEAEKELYGAVPLKSAKRKMRFAFPALPMKPA